MGRMGAGVGIGLLIRGGVVLDRVLEMVLGVGWDRMDLCGGEEGG